MTAYVVTFEVNDAGRRERLKEALKAYGSYCPINENSWAIVVNKTATEVRDELMKVALTPDRLFVIRSGTEAAWANIYGEANSEWLKKWL